MAMAQLPSVCPSENELLAWVSSGLPPARVSVLDLHLDTCSACRAAAAEAATLTRQDESRAEGLSTFAAGELVAGRYVIARRLGAGGMGEVYEAQDTWLEERVALKTIATTIADDPIALARLKAEVRLARRVTHGNVCRVYDLGFHRRERESVALLSMELLHGITLRQHIKQVGPLPIEAALPIIVQIVSALANAHDVGVIHRDFKTDNVMLVDQGGAGAMRAVVMDFGLARSALASESRILTPHSHAVLGTLDYMSPEQVQGAPATSSSDIFSLGIVMYEMLTGCLPFPGESPLARALSRVTETAPRLRTLYSGVPSEWDQCVARCLALRPKGRFGNVREVVEKLQPIRSSSSPWATRAKGAASAGIAAGLGAAIALSVGRATLPHSVGTTHSSVRALDCRSPGVCPGPDHLR